MKIKFALTSGLILLLMFSFSPQTTNGHRIFEKELEKAYKEASINVSCKLCHVTTEDGTDYTKRQGLGQIFAKEFEGKDFTKKWDGMERADQKVFEKEHMAPAFQKALEKVKKMKKGDETYDLLIKEMKLDGIKAKKKKK